MNTPFSPAAAKGRPALHERKAPPDYLNNPKRQHRISHPTKPCRIGTKHVVSRPAVFFSGFKTGAVNFDHDVLKALFAVIETPGVPGGILLHFQRAGSHATGISRFCRTK